MTDNRLKYFREEAGTLDRATAAAIVSAWAEKTERPMVVGNGFLTRDVADGSGAAPSHLYLFGGMGLASSVAVGLARCAGVDVVALEGDGNFFMGLPGAALCGAAGQKVVHVVLDNGIYESTGGQPIPCVGAAGAVERAFGFGYAWAAVVDSPESLRTALLGAAARQPALVWVRCRSGGPAAARPAADSASSAARLRKWLTQRAAPSEPSSR